MKKNIKCPKCNWNPPQQPLWMCDCSFVWNTFETHGKCPQCDKQWELTQCLYEFGGCGHFSTHKDWYSNSGFSFLKIKNLFERINWYYSSFKKLKLIDNESDYVWDELKSICKKNDLQYGIYEIDKRFSVPLSLDNKTGVEFNYKLDDERNLIEMFVMICENYQDVILPQIFALTSHLNTVSPKVKISVFTDNKQIYSTLSLPYTLTLFKSDYLETNLDYHYRISKDFHNAFKRLLIDNIDPVFIVADLLNRTNKK